MAKLWYVVANVNGAEYRAVRELSRDHHRDGYPWSWNMAQGLIAMVGEGRKLVPVGHPSDLCESVGGDVILSGNYAVAFGPCEAVVMRQE